MQAKPGRASALTSSFPSYTSRKKAALAFDALGPSSQSAIPQLLPLLKNSCSEQAAFALAAMGPMGISALTNAMENSSDRIDGAMSALGHHPTACSNLIPWLIAYESKRSPQDAETIWAIGSINADAPDAVPFLTHSLVISMKGPCALASFDATIPAQALGKFGPQAQSAVPLLRQAETNHTNGGLNVIREALRRITAASTNGSPNTGTLP